MQYLFLLVKDWFKSWNSMVLIISKWLLICRVLLLAISNCTFSRRISFVSLKLGRHSLPADDIIQTPQPRIGVRSLKGVKLSLQKTIIYGFFLISKTVTELNSILRRKYFVRKLEPKVKSTFLLYWISSSPTFHICFVFFDVDRWFVHQLFFVFVLFCFLFCFFFFLFFVFVLFFVSVNLFIFVVVSFARLLLLKLF